MTKVKVFVYGQRWWRRGYGNSSPDFRHGELTMNELMTYALYLSWNDENESRKHETTKSSVNASTTQIHVQ